MNLSSLLSGRKRAQRGFTLVEMLVTLVISLTLISMIASTVLNAASMTLSTHNRLSAYHDANLALDYLAQDIGSVIPADLTQSTLSIYPEQVSAGPNSNASSMWIMLLSRPRSAQQKNNVYVNQGILSAISYRVVYQDTISPTNPHPSKSFALYRSVLPSSSDSAVSFFGQSDLYNFWNKYWNTYTSNGNVPLGDYLLGDVVNIRIDLNYSYFPTPTDAVPNPSATLMSVPLTQNVTWTSDGFTGSDITTTGANVPVSIDLSITILRAHGAFMLKQGLWTLQKAIDRDGIVVSRNLPVRTFSLD